MSEGVPSDISSPEGALHGSMQIPPHHANSDVFPYLPSSGIEYNSQVFEQDRLSTYTGLDNYDTLFEARHGRGTIDNMPKSGEEALVTSSIGMPTTTSSVGMTENLMVGARPNHTPDSRHLPPNQRGHVSVREIPSTTEHNIVSQISTGHILGEGAAIFTDMTETMLTALDQQMALSGEAQKPEGSLMSNTLISGQVPSHRNAGESRAIPRSTDKIEINILIYIYQLQKIMKEATGFYGYTDSVSADNNPMILVELTGLSYRYGTTIYAVDSVNGTMYGKFSVGYR